MSARLHTLATAAMWLALASAIGGTLIQVAHRMLVIVAAFPLSVTIFEDFGSLLRFLGVYPVIILVLAGALAMAVWHLDRWPHRLMAVAFLTLVVALMPRDVQQCWFWWFDWSPPFGACLQRA